MKKYDVEAIKASVRISDIASRYTKLVQKGDEHVGCCPFHNEKTPSFSVNDSKGIYGCFGCGEGGDLISFVEKMENCDFLEAVQKLAGDDFVIDEENAAKMKAEREKERLKISQDKERVMAECARLWDSLPPATEHPYLDRKCILPHMARIDGKMLVLPVYGPDGNIQSVQRIAGKKNEEGKDKFFPKDATIKGGRLNFGICVGRSIVCEGFATGASIYEAVPDRVAVGFSKNGVIDLVRELHAKGQDVAIASDRNALPEMLKLGQELGVPVYAPEEPHDDFNDMSVAMYDADASEEDVFAAVRAIFDGAPLNKIEETKLAATPEPANDDNNGPVDIWGKPMPPAFPTGVFPTPIEQLAIHRGEQAGCDPSGIAMAAFVACSGVISDSIQLKMRVHEPWFERPCLWAMLIGVPSTNKSAMLKYSTAKIKQIDGEMFAENARKLAQWQEDGGVKGSDPMPKITRLRVQDINMESAQEVCRYSPDGVISIQNELTAFFGALSRNGDKGGGMERGFWINAYDGGQYALNRIGRGGATGYIIDNLSVGILGGIQPDVIKRIMSGYSDDGIVQRFLPIVLHDGVEGEDRPAPNVDTDFDALIERLHGMRLDREGAFFMKDYVEFSPEAQEVQYRTSKMHNKLVKSFEAVNGTLASHFGKYNGFFGRMCITMHCIENANNRDGVPRYITLATAERVERLLHEFILPHSIAFYRGMLGLSEDIVRVQAVGGYILAHKLETVTMRTIGRNVAAMKKIDRQEAAKVFEQLEAFGWLIQANKRNDAPSWNVDPEVHVKFASKAAEEVERRAEVRDIIAETVLKIRDERKSTRA